MQNNSQRERMNMRGHNCRWQSSCGRVTIAQHSTALLRTAQHCARGMAGDARSRRVVAHCNLHNSCTIQTAHLMGTRLQYYELQACEAHDPTLTAHSRPTPKLYVQAFTTTPPHLPPIHNHAPTLITHSRTCPHTHPHIATPPPHSPSVHDHHAHCHARKQGLSLEVVRNLEHTGGHEKHACLLCPAHKSLKDNT